jgi:hypothetical protein
MTAHYETARALGSLGRLAEQRGQSETARDRYREASTLYAAVGRAEAAEAVAVRERLRCLEEPAG